MGISRFFLRFLALAGLLSLGNVAWASGQVLSQELDYYEIGDLDSPRATHTEPAMMLMGGGDWVPDAFHWWLEKAGNGHIVILRASGGDDMQQRLYEEAQKAREQAPKRQQPTGKQRAKKQAQKNKPADPKNPGNAKPGGAKPTGNAKPGDAKPGDAKPDDDAKPSGKA